MRRYINNQKELFSFMFDGVLSQDCKQDEVWQHPLAAVPGMGLAIAGPDFQARTETFSILAQFRTCV